MGSTGGDKNMIWAVIITVEKNLLFLTLCLNVAFVLFSRWMFSMKNSIDFWNVLSALSNKMSVYKLDVLTIFLGKCEKHISQTTELLVMMFQRRLQLCAAPLEIWTGRWVRLGAVPLWRRSAALTLTDYLGTCSILSSSAGDGRRRFASAPTNKQRWFCKHPTPPRLRGRVSLFEPAKPPRPYRSCFNSALWPISIKQTTIVFNES